MLVHVYNKHLVLWVVHLRRISPKTYNRCRMYGNKFIYAHKQSIAFTAPIFTIVVISQ